MGALVDRANPRCRRRAHGPRLDHRPPLDLEVETAWGGLSHPRRQTEIIVELGVLPILPILQTMFKKEIRAIVAGSDHFIRRLLHEPDIVAVLPDNGGAGWF